jgi:hypothetical protein
VKRVLVVSPAFPPTSAADLHRVRTSLPHFRDFGWDPIVLALAPEDHGGLVEPELVRTIPSHVAVYRTGALPRRLMRLAGIGDAGLRGLGHLYARGAEVIRRESIDLVYFSTTMFPVMVLGRLWRARFGAPFVMDFQDPWKTDYSGAGRAQGPKAQLARAMHATLEPLAMRHVDGVIAVSPAYIETLRRRYPWISEDMCATIPFGASEADLDAAQAIAFTNTAFDRRDGRRHGVAVGRGGRDMAMAAEILFRALGLLLERRDHPALKLSVVGTDYARHGGRATIAPLAEQFGVAAAVEEHPERVPYLHALRLLRDSHFTIILGSDDPAYSPSKIYPYLIARRPFLAIMHADSPAVPLLRQAGTGIVATFRPDQDLAPAVARLAENWPALAARGPTDAMVPKALLESISARELTRRQCMVFDAAAGRRTLQGVPCTG